MKSFHIAVIGAGISGIHMGVNLKRLGYSFTIYEKAGEIGGTWRDNIYPGLVVDVPVSDYQYSFAPKYDWSRPLAPGYEIQEYLLDVTEKFGIREHIEFETGVTTAEWGGSSWQLKLSTGDAVDADVVIAATGFLRDPKMPTLPGMDTFQGESFHSSQWPEGLDVIGKKVGIVGTGSSGIQLVAALADMGANVTQFVRTPQWIETIDNPVSEAPSFLTDDVEEKEEYLAKLVTKLNQDERLQDPRWKLAGGESMRDAAREALIEDIAAIRDPELRKILTPSDALGCKRIPKSADYYRAVQQSNVRVVPVGVTMVTRDGVISSDGESHELDIIVYATGFDAHAYMRPMGITGQEGMTLNRLWEEAPFSYRGVGLPSFPNFFMLEGPYSPINNVAVPITLDHQVGYVLRLIDEARNANVAIAPTHDATSRYRQAIREAAADTVWAQGCDNWYLDRTGTPIIWPWYDVEHASMLKDLSPEDLQISSRGATEEAKTVSRV